MNHSHGQVKFIENQSFYVHRSCQTKYRFRKWKFIIGSSSILQKEFCYYIWTSCWKKDIAKFFLHNIIFLRKTVRIYNFRLKLFPTLNDLKSMRFLTWANPLCSDGLFSVGNWVLDFQLICTNFSIHWINYYTHT